MPCIVPGCTSGYPRNTEKVHFFIVPANPSIRSLWKEAIKSDSVKAGRAVCEKHFKQEEILWQRQFIGPLGEVVGVGQYKIPRLRKGSVPSHFPWTKKIKLEIESPQNEQNAESRLNDDNRPSVLRLQKHDARSPRKEEKMSDLSNFMFERQTSMHIDETSTILVDEKQSNEVFVKIECTETDTLTFGELLTTKLCLPQGWFEYSSSCNGKMLIIFFTNEIARVQETYDIRPLKSLMVMEDMTVELKVSGFRYETNDATVPRRATSIKELQDTLLRIHRMNVCQGLPKSTTFGLEEECRILRKDAHDTWRHIDCFLLSINQVCLNCKKAKDAVSPFKHRSVQREKSIRMKQCLRRIEDKRNSCLLRTRQRSALRATSLARKKLKILRTEVMETCKRLSTCSNEDLQRRVKDGKIPQNYLRIVEEILNAAKHRNSKGQIYSEQLMLLCMILHSRSPSDYDFLRSNNILPLPYPETTRRYLSKIKATRGFDSQFFEVLKVVLNKKRETDRHGILVVNEMANRESIVVETREMTHKGLIDFAFEGITLSAPTDKANAGLILKFQSLDADYCQPIAVFASSGPVKGDVLAQLIIKAIILLEKIGARVHGVVSDGASSSREFWSELGICGGKSKLRNYFEHPVDEQRRIYIFSDIPHIFETIRNRLYDKGVLQLDPSEQPIKWKFIELLYRKDRELARPGQALVCPKLTADQIYLNNSLKTPVRLAIQVFSNSVSAGLLFFKKYESAMKDCGATASFCKWLNDLFDALNRTRRINGVQPGHSDFKVIQESLRNLDAWEEHIQKGTLSKELFLSQQTAECLRVTLKSMLDLIEYLTQRCSFPYVLTGRVSQDSLEVFPSNSL